MDPDYISAPFEQYVDSTTEYRYSLVVEDNNQNLGAGCQLVESNFEGNSHPRVKWAAGKWDPTESDKSGAQVDLAVA